MYNLGIVAGTLGDFERADAFFAAAIVGLRAQGNVGALANALVFQAWTAIWRGSWKKAEVAADEALRLTQETQQTLWTGVAALAQAAVAMAHGDVARAEALAASVEQGILAVGAHPLLSLVQIVRGLGALGQGRHAEAYDHLRRLFDPSDSAYHPYVRWWAASDYLEAAALSGRQDEARHNRRAHRGAGASAHAGVASRASLCASPAGRG
jgi:hypothetical protein